MIASCSKPTTSWTTYAEQKSAVFSLKRGRRYYIESLHVQDAGKSHVSIGVKLQKTRFVNSQIGAAVNEKQEIRIGSVKHPEIQVSKILCSLCARAERPKPRKLVLVSGVESIHELDIHLPPLIPERKNVSPLNSYPVRIMAPVLNYTPGIVKKVSSLMYYRKTEHNQCWTSCMPDANLEVLTFGLIYLHRLRLHTETTEKTRLHGLFRDLTLKEWQSVFHVVAVVNS